MHYPYSAECFGVWVSGIVQRGGGSNLPDVGVESREVVREDRLEDELQVLGRGQLHRQRKVPTGSGLRVQC